MAFNIIEVDGVKVDLNTKKFPVEVFPETHALNGPHHTGILDDGQIPQSIMRDNEHQNDPHTMIIDGRDVSVDGAKLDTIENGAEVNNLSDQQANSLVSGAHSSWHHHDDFYYRKSNLQTSGEAQVNWNNITNLPPSFPPDAHNHDDRYYTEAELLSGAIDSRYFTETEIEDFYYSKNELQSGSLDSRYFTETEIATNYYTKTNLQNGILDSRYYTETEVNAFLDVKSNVGHNHDDRYYTKSELNSGQLDNRYFTETEVNTNFYDKIEIDTIISNLETFGIKGAVDVFSLLPSSAQPGDVYIVRNEEGVNPEGFYRYDDSWSWLAHNVGGIYHNDLLGLNQGELKHLTTFEYNQLTSINATIHNHDQRYYTETEIDNLLSSKSNTSHLHDDRYYTETEIDGFLNQYYDKDHLDNGQLDDRYYTETEIDGGQLDDRYYTETEVDSLLSSKSDVGHLHDDRYYTETEVDSLLSSKSDVGHVHDDRYYTETQIDGFLSNKSNINHTHDDLYYTESEVDSLLSSRSDVDHIHDDRYFTETEIATNYYDKAELDGGQLDDRYYTETEINSFLNNYYTKIEVDSVFNDYYTKSELNNGELDNRYFTELEITTNYYDKSTVDSLITAASFGIAGSANTFPDLPTVNDVGVIYIVKTTSGSHEEGFYRWDGASWNFLANNTGTTTHGALPDLENDDHPQYLNTLRHNAISGNPHGVTLSEVIIKDSGTDITISELETLTNGSDASLLHHHDQRYHTRSQVESLYYSKIQIDDGQLDDRYYTEAEIDAFLNQKADINHIHDDLYYSKAQVDNLISTRALNTHIHDDRYYTETEVDSLLSSKSDVGHVHDDRYYTKDELNTGQLDDRYYVKTEVDALLIPYYTKIELDNGELDSRYFTETEITTNYYTKSNLSISGQSSVHWNNLTNIPSEFNPIDHNHNDLYYTKVEINGFMEDYYTSVQLNSGILDTRYYTKTQIQSNYFTKSALLNGSLDSRYYTEAEVDNLITAASFGITGSADTYDDLPTPTDAGVIYIVKQTSGSNEEGFYKWDGTAWEFLANNTGTTEHNNLSGLNLGDYLHLTSSEYVQLTTGINTALHHHDDRYYTETEIDGFLNGKANTGHHHDDRYYTETEIDNLLNNYYDISYIDSNFYTLTSVDNLLSNKADVSHNHDERYFTKNYIQSNYYTRSQLNNGILDNRYYTETEVDTLLSSKSDVGHVHDDRYYTETEVDSLLSSKSDVGHVHDDRYYTETEVDSLLSVKADIHHNHHDLYYQKSELASSSGVSGAKLIGVSMISGLSSSNVQDALSELKNDINSTSSTLDEAYDGGRSITADNGPVVINSTSSTEAPLELTERMTPPTTNLSSGQLFIINGILYIYDGNREKWLSQTKLLALGRNNNADGHMLEPAGVRDYYSGYKIIRNATIVGASLQSSSSTTKDIYILNDTSIIYTLTTGPDGNFVNKTLDIDFNEGDVLKVYVEPSGPPLKDPVMTVEIAWRA